MRTRVAWALLVILPVAAGACRRSRPTTATLRIALESEPPGLCDLASHDVSGMIIARNNVLETLFENDERGHLRGRLASSWKMSDDAIVLTLRPATWHDGVALTADDVVFTLESVRDPKLGAEQRSALDAISTIETEDAHTVRLGLRWKIPIEMLPNVTIYPKHLLAGQDLRTSTFCRAPIGTGPFRFSSWESGVGIELARNETYLGDRAHLERVSFRFVRDRQAALLLLTRGELDVVGRLPIRHDPLPAGYRVDRFDPHTMTFVLWNVRRFSEPRVRAALGHLFDVPRLIANALDGRARPQSGPYLRGTPSYDESIEPWPFDPNALDGVNVPKRISFLVTTGSTASEQLGTMLEEDLRKAGVTLVIETLDFARVLERVRAGDFDSVVMSLPLAPLEDNYGLFHTATEQNWGGFSDPRVDTLLDNARVAPDLQTRYALDRQLHAQLHERGPMTFLLSPEQERGIAPGVSVRASVEGYDLQHAFRSPP